MVQGAASAEKKEGVSSVLGGAVGMSAQGASASFNLGHKTRSPDLKMSRKSLGRAMISS